MADDVHAAMAMVERSAGESVLDGAALRAEVRQLLAAARSALASGDAGDPLVDLGIARLGR